jgi:protein gp37/predicted transcriptional regulator
MTEKMKREDAEEYTQSLGQIIAGSWRQIALAERLGVPAALGMKLREWVRDRLGGYIQMEVPERKQAALELKMEGQSNKEIGDILGISKETVRRDLSGTNEPKDANIAPSNGTNVPVAPSSSSKQIESFESSLSAMRLNVSLEQWKTLDRHMRVSLLDTSAAISSVHFNRQDSGDIEWAQWSWNPVTGCLHDCPYCYARDIANSSRMATAYPHGFSPAFRPVSLLAPVNSKVPKEAKGDTRYRNVFTCSMADLFGRWVPSEWIEAVLKSVESNPQWNFLFLTKFPKRMAEFNIPENAWMGTTVDLQVRVKNAETAFAKIKSGVRWLSVEPLIEPLKFERLDLFQWMVIGGASRSSITPEWHPPTDWINDLKAQARKAGLKIYEKTNLYGNRTLELPFDAPIKSDPVEAPAAFHYLGKESTGEQLPELQLVKTA